MNDFTYHDNVPVDREVTNSVITEEPVNCIVERETLEVTYGEQVNTWDVDFETEYRETDDLPFGEERVVQEGQTGSREDTVRYTYHNGVPFGEPEVINSEIVTASVNRIVERGTYSDQINEEYIDFETEYRETDELLEGEERVVQEGERGLERLTRRYYYRDGVPVRSEVIGTPEVLRAPVKRIIEVGTVEVTYGEQVNTWDIDFETEYRETDDLPLGEERVIQEGQQGTRCETLRYTYHDGVPFGEPEVLDSEVVTAPVNRIVEVGTWVEEEEEYIALGIVVEGLDGKRTSDVRVRVTNEDGERVAGSFNQWGQWISAEELPVGNYRISLRTPRGTYAVIDEDVEQGTEGTYSDNIFNIYVHEDHMFYTSRVYASLELVMDEDLANVIEAINDATLDGDWYRRYPRSVAAARAAYDALDDDLKDLVINYDNLLVSEARVSINDLIREVRGADLDEEDYTEESWDELAEAYSAAVIVRDDQNATVDSITKDFNDLRYAFDNLVTKEEAAWNDLLERLDEIEERLADLEAENDDLRAELDRLEAELAALRADQEAAEERINELEDRIAELEDRVDEVEETETPTTPETPEEPSDEEPADEDDLVDDEDDLLENDDADDDNADGDDSTSESPQDVVVTADDSDAENLPQTGMAASSIGLGIASLLSGLGLAFIDKKRKK